MHSPYIKLATARTIPILEGYVNEYAYSTGYKIDPVTLAISHPTHTPPIGWFVMTYRGGYLFGRTTTT